MSCKVDFINLAKKCGADEHEFYDRLTFTFRLLIIFAIAKEALANKSNWITEHDAEVRKATVLNCANYLDSFDWPAGHKASAETLRRTAQGAKE
jgi:hypothetical protein